MIHLERTISLLVKLLVSHGVKEKNIPDRLNAFHATEKPGKKSAFQWRISFPAGTLFTMV